MGQKLNDVMRQSARANPELKGVINRIDSNKQDEIPKDRLIKLVGNLFCKYGYCELPHDSSPAWSG